MFKALPNDTITAPTVTVTQVLTETDFVADVDDNVIHGTFGSGETPSYEEIFHTVPVNGGVSDTATGIISVKTSTPNYCVHLTATVKAYKGNINPTLSIRKPNAAKGFLGVTSNSDGDLRLGADEGLELAVSKITEDFSGNIVTTDNVNLRSLF